MEQTPTFTGCVVIRGALLIVMLLSALTSLHGPEPSGSFVVSLRMTSPLKLTGGVYVTNSGFAVWAVLDKVPPPETIDQAALAAAVKLAPDNVIGVGVAP